MRRLFIAGLIAFGAMFVWTLMYPVWQPLVSGGPRQCQVCFSRNVSMSKHRMEYRGVVQVTTLVRCGDCGAVSHLGTTDTP